MFERVDYHIKFIVKIRCLLISVVAFRHRKLMYFEARCCRALNGAVSSHVETCSVYFLYPVQ